MLRLLLIALLLCVGCRLLFGKWPWDFARRNPTRQQAVSQARKLLTVKPGASRTEVLAAHKRLVAMVHPDRGGTDARVHEANAARDLLLDEVPDPVEDQR